MFPIKKQALNAIIFFRILIGWHFLYEGVIKLYSPSWTSSAYLNNATGPFSEFFGWLASESIIGTVDLLNIWGLTLIGLTLILGLFDRIGAIAGMILLLFYYFSQPPFPGLEQLATEGNYFMVNKNLIEAAGLLVLYLIPTGNVFGLSLLLGQKKEEKILTPQ